MAVHTSVLLEETLAFLEPRPGSLIVDGTLGFGGHAARILEKLGPEGRLIGFDRDPEALEIARAKLEPFGDRALLQNERFSQIPNRLRELGVTSADGVFLDLGVSSLQLDEPRRGFSFREDGPLDMRMGPQEQRRSAADWVNDAPAEKLLDILWTFGQERYARRIVRAIEQARDRQRIETTGELARLVSGAVPSFYRHGRIHPATRTFQALRMAVNAEMDELQEFLRGASGILSQEGRLVIISFHSIEDRMVKNTFRQWKSEGQGDILTKKPVTPSEGEIRGNVRSRSAKLRAFVKSSAGGGR